jgi:hypothetical protein
MVHAENVKATVWYSSVLPEDGPARPKHVADGVL